MDKKECIIIDIDGTLANLDHRVHLAQRKNPDWRSFHDEMDKDLLNTWCFRLIECFQQKGIGIILLTGRDDSYREMTKQWLLKHRVFYHHLFMRLESDRREDAVVKRDIFEENIKENYKTLFVVLNCW